METWLQHFATTSTTVTLVIVLSVAFLESLALVGLLLPGTVLMVSLGTLIGNGHIGLYPAWAVATLGCMLGDGISYFIGRAFKQPLHNWSFLQKYHPLLRKTEYALYQHSMVTILSGRFIGPTRPLIPMVAGMLNLPLMKFALPDIIGCLLWPPVWFFPGILAGVVTEIPAHTSTWQFRWLLFMVAILTVLACWLLWRWWQEGKRDTDVPSRWLLPVRLKWGSIVVTAGALCSAVALSLQPVTPIYWQMLCKVLMGQH